jgi:hypothetical protein
MAPAHRKTAKGLSEIETRAHRLPPRLRSALILVDGKRNDDELAKLILQDPAQAITFLRDEGFIEPVPAPPPASPRPAGPPAAAKAPAAPPFEQVRRDAVRALTDAVGPLGEALAIRMERARNAAELKPLIEIAMQVIANTRGAQAAQDYGRRFDLG